MQEKKTIVGHKTEIVIVYKIQCLFVNEWQIQPC